MKVNVSDDDLKGGLGDGVMWLIKDGAPAGGGVAGQGERWAWREP